MKFIKKYLIEIAATLVVAIIVVTSIWFAVEDASELTHYSTTGSLIDKWHENVCSTIYDGTNYYSDCDDVYTLSFAFEDGQTLKRKISNHLFRSYRIGETIDYQYDRGKLGGIYHEEFNHVN